MVEKLNNFALLKGGRTPVTMKYPAKNVYGK